MDEAQDFEVSFDAAIEGVLGAEPEADQPTGEQTEEAAGTTGAEEASGETGTEQTAEPEADQPEVKQEQEPDVYHLKWLDDVRDVNREEVVQLAQKGLDYDRMRGQRDEARTALSELEAYKAKNAATVEDLEDFMTENNLESVGEVLDAMRVARLTQKGVNRDVAIEQVKRGRAERALARAQKQTEQKQETEKKESQAEADVRAFMKAHPDESLKDLLPKLEKDLTETGNLEVAYLRYSLRQARKEAADAKESARAAAQNADNKRRSGGSMQSAGGGTDGVAEALAKLVLSND